MPERLSGGLELDGRRSDPVSGVVEHATSVGPAGQRVYAYLYLPPRPTAAVVVVPSIYAEFIKSYRREVLLARSLAERGVAVARFHYRGTGNSEGSPAEMTFETMVSDAALVRDELVCRSATSAMGLVGVRLGALVAARLARGVPGMPVALWEPVVDTAGYFAEIFRSQLMADMKKGAALRRSRDDLAQELCGTGSVDILGYAVTRRFHDSASDRTLPDELGWSPRDVLLVQLSQRESFLPAYEGLVEAWGERGLTVETTSIREEAAWWFIADDWQPVEGRAGTTHVLGRTVDWLDRSLAGREPMMNAPRGASEEMIADGATSYDERPTFFPAGGETLFGILTPPVAEPSGLAVLIASGGLMGTSTVGRNQFFVRLARSAAAAGHHAFRFDYHGIGESTGVVQRFSLEDPFADDVIGAARRLQRDGHERVVLVGKCFGSRSALAASDRIEDLCGIVLIGIPVRDFTRADRQATGTAGQWTVGQYVRKGLRPRTLKRLTDPRRRRLYARYARAKLRAVASRFSADEDLLPDGSGVSHRFLAPFEGLLARGVPVLMIWGDEDDFLADFERARHHGRLSRLLAKHAGLVTVRTLPGKVQGFEQVASQAPLVEAIEAWIDDQVAVGGRA